MRADPGQRRERFSAIYAALHGRVEAYAARRVGADAAGDVTAETFLIAWRRFDAMPSDPLPWLYGVARRVVARHRARTARREAAQRALEPTRILADAPDDHDPALWDAWVRLSTTDQEVLALVAWEDLTVRDAAEALGCSAPVFSVRLHRARKRLEQLLKTTSSPFPGEVATVSEAS
jgi:RNA polymerase sigma-70 factor (ECF subfamily)